MKYWQSTFLKVGIFVILYVLLGNARSSQANPFIPGANIAINMIVPVIAGIVFGPRIGFATGLIGTSMNFLTPAGNMFELAAIPGHAVMGGFAGVLKDKIALPFSAMVLFAGHMMNLTSFYIFGLIDISIIANISLWYGILYETFVGIVGITIIVTIYRLAEDEIAWD